jgi:transposase-like protein
MELEVGGPTGAPAGPAQPDRLDDRNGYRERPGRPERVASTWRSPSSARALTCPSFLEPRRTAEKALTAGDPGGLRARDLDARVDDLVKAMGGSGVSKSQVSRLCERLTSG